MNWGNSIVVAFVLFAAFIGYMVVRAFQQNIDLVAEDYYAQEVDYQNKLNSLANAAEENKSIAVKQQGDQILLVFPDLKAEGDIHFYHPSREIFDKTFPINLTDNNTQKIKCSELVAGNYRVNIKWKTGDKDYFQQSKIFIR